jgi:hypothetical protein
MPVERPTTFCVEDVTVPLVISTVEYNGFAVKRSDATPEALAEIVIVPRE